MAVTSSILNNHRLKQDISLVASAQNDAITIPLTSLLLSDETSSSSINLTVNIAAAWSNMTSGAPVTISRSGQTVLLLNGHGQYPGYFKLPAISTNNTTGITVTFGYPGQVILELHKVAGFVVPNYNEIGRAHV